MHLVRYFLKGFTPRVEASACSPQNVKAASVVRLIHTLGVTRN
jgi:hypothetical protein